MHGLEVGRAVEGVPMHEQEFDQIAGDVAPRAVMLSREVGEGEAIKDRNGVDHTLSGDLRASECRRVWRGHVRVGAGLRRERVHTLRVERKHRLDGDVHAIKTILLKPSADDWTSGLSPVKGMQTRIVLVATGLGRLLRGPLVDDLLCATHRRGELWRKIRM